MPQHPRTRRRPTRPRPTATADAGADTGTGAGSGAGPGAEADRLGLHADCTRCFGLCCTVLPFSRSADFPEDKPAGRACRHLRQDFRCGIHSELRDRGYTGCTVFDCFGAGQKVSQATFGGRAPHTAPGDLAAMAEAFSVLRPLHELLWYLAEALRLPRTEPLHGELRTALAATEQLTLGDPAQLAAVDVPAHRAEVNDLLLRSSERARAGIPGRRDHHGADLAGARLRGARLRGASLRGALLIAADLTRADLTSADLIGADLRGTLLAGADLTGALFLTQAQLNAARGDTATVLPAHLSRPYHWVS
ncbi:pentapeptide repeat-containing protein [Streptomyces sp. NPDC058045]|uniref:pentapeptide repeat-containing protein n=1 Tax=Streptomyces sp. NPDC058045 TaxID=3346311 RepID=UPI0036E561AE